MIKRLAWILLLIIGVINLTRGLGHFLSDDSAAGKAGISLNTSSRPDIIYLFAIIGGVQIVLAIFYIYVAIFNHKILPVALLMEIAKTSLNLYTGFIFKPSSATPVVGSQQDELQLGLAVIALLLVLLPNLIKSLNDDKSHTIAPSISQE